MRVGNRGGPRPPVTRQPFDPRRLDTEVLIVRRGPQSRLRGPQGQLILGEWQTVTRLWAYRYDTRQEGGHLGELPHTSLTTRWTIPNDVLFRYDPPEIGWAVRVARTGETFRILEVEPFIERGRTDGYFLYTERGEGI